MSERTTKTIHSVCTYCGVGCDIAAKVEGNTILSIGADPAGTVSRGRLCVKGKEGYNFVSSSNRITRPRIKRSFIDAHRGTFPEAIGKKLFLLRSYDHEWYDCDPDVAYDIAAWKLQSLLETYGPDSHASIGGARTSCENAWFFQHFTRNLLGSPHIDNCARVCHSPSLAGMKRTIGEGAATNPFDDFLDAEFILAIGTNTTEAHPIASHRILEAKAKGAVLAVADIRKITLSKQADFHLTLPFESNLLFLNMMAYVILSEGLENRDFIGQRTEGFDTYREQILNDPYANPDFFLGLPGYEELAHTVKAVARLYAGSRSMILWGLGISEHLDGSAAVSAIVNLALLTGNVGKKGAGLMPMRGQNNVQGACDMGCLPYYDPDYQTPKVVGKMTPELVEGMLAGEIKSLYNLGEDLAHIHPNQAKVQKALEQLEFVVVNELVPNEITRYADILFGVKSAYEKTGVYVNAERRLHLSQPLVESEMPDDWEVLQEIASRMGKEKAFDSGEAVWNAARESAPNRFSGASYEKLSANRLQGLQWPVKETGTVRLHLEEFRTDNGKGQFFYQQYALRGQVQEMVESNREEESFYLSTGRVLHHYNNAAQTKESERLYFKHDEDVLLVSDADRDRFDPEKKYILASPHGRSRPLKIKITPALKRGTLFTTFHHAKSHVNFVFGDECDEIVKTARFKSVKVTVEPE